MFITEVDLKGKIYDEELDAVTRKEPTAINDNINLAIEEVDTYLNQRYDTSEIWVKRGNERHNFIKHLCVDIALYHIHSILSDVPVIRRERYDYAVSKLKEIRKGETKLPGVPLVKDEPEEKDQDILHGGIDTRY
jgi:phage gp36-like protein